MAKRWVTLLGKAVRRASLLRGGGSALPGLVVERIDPGFVPRTLEPLPFGVAVVSGTNGKTTTTKIVVELLRSQGLRVFTNRTGSNFTRGVASALLAEVDGHGALDADVAVLELDEAHAVHFVAAVTPRYSLVLNVLRDQLDRFGEIDTAAKMLRTLARSTSQTVVLNRHDPLVTSSASSIRRAQIRYFGLSAELTQLFPSDDRLRGPGSPARSGRLPDADVVLHAVRGQSAVFLIDGHEVATTLQLQGLHNVYNAAAALALARSIVGSAGEPARLVAALPAVAPAFGRGETLTIEGRPVSLVLIKNPSGFRLSLSSFSSTGCQTMIAVNDQPADGRDVSWLWDVDFGSLRTAGVAVVTGSRAFDVALRLQYDEVTVSHIDPDLPRALHQALSAGDEPLRIYCTYTAMRALRRELARLTDLEVVS